MGKPLASYDTIIIGAGIAGISLAAQLSRYCKVLLLDAEQNPGYHATGRSAAFFAPAYGNDVVRAITAASEDFFRNPAGGFTSTPLLHPRHALFIATDEQKKQLSAQHDQSPHLQTMDAAEIKRRVPILNIEKIKHAANDTTGGDLDVNAILQGYLRQFRTHGGDLQTNAKVAGLKWADGYWKVSTTSDSFIAPIVVNAAGAWADTIAKLASLDSIGITPYRRTALLVDAPVAEDISAWPLVIDIDEGFYFKPDAGQLLISPADETKSTACDAFPDELDIAIAIDRVQKITDLQVKKVNHSWAGLRSFAPDKTFVAGFDPRAKGFFWLAGQGGYGVQSAPGLADIALFLITGNHDLLTHSQVKEHIIKIAPDRFL